MNTRSSIRVGLAIAALLAFVVLPSFVHFSTDWLWFGAIGYRDVFLRGLKAKASLGAFVLGIGFLMLYGNFWIAMSSVVGPYIVLGTGRGTVQPAFSGGRSQRPGNPGVGSLVSGRAPLPAHARRRRR